MRDALKAAAHALATAFVLPALASYAIRRSLIGANRALEGSTQALGQVPGLTGCYLRRAFLSRVLPEFHRSTTVEFGTILSQAGARMGASVYVGPGCYLGLVHLERDVLVGSGVQIPSGPATHGITRLDCPIREQPGTPVVVRVGEGAWIGSGAIVLADVGAHAVIGAGAVVTTPIPDYAIAAGVPARVVRDRRTSGDA